MLNSRYQACIEACSNCAMACETCAASCLREDDVKMMARCIELDRDCADICATTGAVLSRQTGNNVETTRALLEACRTACKTCGDECASHAEMHEHCKICADACRRRHVLRPRPTSPSPSLLTRARVRARWWRRAGRSAAT